MIQILEELLFPSPVIRSDEDGSAFPEFPVASWKTTLAFILSRIS